MEDVGGEMNIEACMYVTAPLWKKKSLKSFFKELKPVTKLQI